MDSSSRPSLFSMCTAERGFQTTGKERQGLWLRWFCRTSCSHQARPPSRLIGVRLENATVKWFEEPIRSHREKDASEGRRCGKLRFGKDSGKGKKKRKREKSRSSRTTNIQSLYFLISIHRFSAIGHLCVFVLVLSSCLFL